MMDFRSTNDERIPEIVNRMTSKGSWEERADEPHDNNGLCDVYELPKTWADPGRAEETQVI